MANGAPKKPKIKILTSGVKSATKNDAKTPLAWLLGSKLSVFKFWPKALARGIPKMASTVLKKSKIKRAYSTYG